MTADALPGWIVAAGEVTRAGKLDRDEVARAQFIVVRIRLGCYDTGSPRLECCLPSGPRMASSGVGSSPRRGPGGRGLAFCRLAGAGSAPAPVIHEHCADSGQGGKGRPVVVAAQQQVNGMPATRGGRDDYPYHRPGSAAAGTITQSRRPAPVSPVIRVRGRRPVVGGSPAVLARRYGNLILMEPVGVAAGRLSRDLALVPIENLGPKHPGRPSWNRKPEHPSG